MPRYECFHTILELLKKVKFKFKNVQSSHNTQQVLSTQPLKTEKYIRSRNTGRFLIEFSFFVSDIKTLHTNFKWEFHSLPLAQTTEPVGHSRIFHHWLTSREIDVTCNIITWDVYHLWYHLLGVISFICGMIDEDYNIVSDGFAFNIENITHLVTFSLIICTQSKIFIMTFNIFKSSQMRKQL